MKSLNLEVSISKQFFSSFCRTILNQKLGKMHEEWIEEIMNGRKHINLKAARGHFKTSIMSVAFPLWVMFRFPKSEKKVILICSASMRQSSKIMGLIKDQILENPILRDELLPESIHETKWSESEIKTKKGHIVVCLPFSDTVRGNHCDYCICDDVLTSETTNIDYAKETFYSVVFPTVQAKRGKHIVVGTPMSYTDLLAELETKDGFKTMVYPAIKANNVGEWLSPTFPEMFTMERLLEIRNTIPAHSWSREYMCRPISSASSLFPYETHIKPNIALWEKMRDKFTKDEVPMLFLGVDIAFSESKGADFSVLTELKKIRDEPLFVSRIIRHKGFSTQEVKDLHRANQYARIVVEQTGLGQGPVFDLARDDGTRSAIHAFDTKSKSRELILSRLEILLRNGQLALPNNEELIAELMAMGIKNRNGKETYESLGVHDDTVMSLAFAVFGAEQFNDIPSIAFV
jgi:hypothetical protein